MDEKQIEMMANDIIKFLKKKKMWETDCGLIYNGLHVQHTGVTNKDEELNGVMRIWYEGPLVSKIDVDAKFFDEFDKIAEKYGCYLQPDSYCDLNVYEI